MFLRPAGGTGSADDGRVDEPQVAAQASVPLEVVEQMGQDLGPGAVATPAVEAVVGSRPRSIASGRSRQGAPVWRIQRMPLRRSRWGFQGCPLPPWCVGWGRECSSRSH
jgi:hypothetical protein